MAKGTRGRHRIASRRPYPVMAEIHSDEMLQTKSSKVVCRKDWENATCSVCMEYPHNAVLVLCSSHDKGCRPYMCATSCRYSNCLDQYKKAYTKVTTPCPNQYITPAADHVLRWTADKREVTELACPLCRGQVKGWTVVDSAREYFNLKKRSCMHDSCSFVGNYKEIRKHVRAVHPCVKPCEVDPLVEQKWRRLVGEREREDVISTLTSSMPSALVIGDYVVEGGVHGFISEEEDAFDDYRQGFFDIETDSRWMNASVFLQSIGSEGSLSSRRHDSDSNGTLEGSRMEISHSASHRIFVYSDDDSEGDDPSHRIFVYSDDDSEGDDDRDHGSLVNHLHHQNSLLF